MGLFSKPHNLEKVEKDKAYYKAESEMLQYKSEAEEKKAVIQQLKKEYGPGWKKLLGIGGKEDSSTLKSFLTRFKVKAKDLHSTGTDKLSPLPGNQMRHPGGIQTPRLPKY